MVGVDCASGDTFCGGNVRYSLENMFVPEPVIRRPIPSRNASWAIHTARRLQRMGVRPNQISILGVVFAAIAAVCFILAGRSEGGTRIALLLAAAMAMPLRLLCNLLDGMVAVEGGLKTPSGALYNEFPDRLSDPLILVGAGGYWQVDSTDGLRIAYGGPVVEWRVFPDKAVGLNVHGLIGGGWRYADDSYFANFGQPRVDHRGVPNGRFHTLPYGFYDDVFFIAEPEAQVVVRLASWIRLQGGVGYRATSSENTNGASGSVSVQFGR